MCEVMRSEQWWGEMNMASARNQQLMPRNTIAGVDREMCALAVSRCVLKPSSPHEHATRCPDASSTPSSPHEHATRKRTQCRKLNDKRHSKRINVPRTQARVATTTQILEQIKGGLNHNRKASTESNATST